MTLPRVPLLLFAPLLAAAARADVLVVDAAGGPGTDHLAIQPAVDAALAGDVLLVRAGTYPGFAIHGKPLTVTADQGHVVRVAGEITVRFVPAGEAVHLRGLSTLLLDVPLARGLVLGSNAGAVLVEDCVLRGETQEQDDPPQPGLVVVDSEDVVLLASTFVGGGGWSYFQGGPHWGTSGAPGARVVSQSATTTVYAYGCEFEGGYGSSGVGESHFPGLPGGDGLRLESGVLYASGSTFRGGAGGGGADGGFGTCGDGGPGGAGLDEEPGGEAIVADSTFAGGPGGLGGNAFCLHGDDGPPFEGDPLDLAEPARLLSSPGPVREGQILQLVFHGPPGEVVTLLAGPTDPQLLLTLFGARLVSAQHRAIPMGTIPASGALVKSLPMPTLPASIEHVVLSLQGLHATGAGNRLGGGTLLVLLDASF